MTFYLKYRPKKVSELDLPEISRKLKDILKSGSPPHAFLFIGPRGAGKTSAARIIAKALNCENPGKDGEPCNECDQCKATSASANLDVIEIDAASHRGVDDIRSLREGVKLSPVGAKKKVYIIDEAHMLTADASNALLKTLEEPPSHVIFILATTESHKVLDTIKSRCTIFNFRKARPEEVEKSLQKAVKGEKIKIDEEALDEISNNVDGSFREAHKILEQLTYSTDKITKEAVSEILSLTPTSPIKLVEALAKYQPKEALGELSAATEGGVSLRHFTKSIISILRESLLANYGREANLPRVEFESQEELERALELFSQASVKIPGAVIPQLPLELAIVKFCNDRQPTTPDSSSKPKQTQEKQPARLRQQASSPNHPKTSAVSQNQLQKHWEEVLEKVKPHNYSIEALLRATRPSSLTGTELIIEVFYQFHKERLESEQFRVIIEKVASEVLGEKIRLICHLSEPGKRATDLVNVSEDVDDDIVKIAEEVFGDNKGKNKLPN